MTGPVTGPHVWLLSGPWGASTFLPATVSVELFSGMTTPRSTARYQDIFPRPPPVALFLVVGFFIAFFLKFFRLAASRFAPVFCALSPHKVRKALNNGLKVILCCGESFEEYNSGLADVVCR